MSAGELDALVALLLTNRSRMLLSPMHLLQHGYLVLGHPVSLVLLICVIVYLKVSSGYIEVRSFVVRESFVVKLMKMLYYGFVFVVPVDKIQVVIPAAGDCAFFPRFGHIYWKVYLKSQDSPSTSGLGPCSAHSGSSTSHRQEASLQREQVQSSSN
jgi:hypothetical protein